MSNPKAEYEIPRSWTFDRPDIAKHFDQHVREQLPWYDLATELVTHIGRHHLLPGGRMYDIGASTGNITRSLQHEITVRNIKATSIEMSKDMALQWEGTGELVIANALDYEYENFDFASIFLVLMFMPPNRIDDYLNMLYEKINRGGALVIFDKVAHHGGYFGNMMNRITLAGKMKAGVPADEIVAKELSLGGIQRPLERGWYRVLRDKAEVVFQYGEFVGWFITRV